MLRIVLGVGALALALFVAAGLLLCKLLPRSAAAPSHPHYGRDGAYRNCGHYFAADATLFARCKNGERAFYGEATAENLQLGLVERIAFNPFYADMVKSIDAFTATIEQ